MTGMRSRLQIGGHPLHAMVVGYPIGLYTLSLVCDLLYVLAPDSFWFRMAFWAIAFGLLTHLMAAATGFPDFLAVMKERADTRRPAATHLIFGIGLLVVQGLNLAVRNFGEIPAGGSIAFPLIMNVIGVSLTGIQGWYGGELVYKHWVGVELPASQSENPSAKHKHKKH